MNLPKIRVSPRKRRILLRVLLLVAGAYALTFFLEYRHFINNFGEAWHFVTTRWLVFNYSALIMGLALLFSTAIFRKPWTSIGLMSGFIIVITYIHINKFAFRACPLLPEDFLLSDQAGTLTSFIDVGGLVRMLIALVLVGILTALLNHLTGRFFLREKHSEPKTWWKRYDVAPRLALAIIAVLGLLVTTDFVRHHTSARYVDAPWLDTYFIAWSQTDNYEKNGFILGFLYNLNKSELQPPDGYSEERMAEIAKKWLAKKQDGDSGRVSLDDTGYNIIVVLNESFYDSSIVRDYYSYTGDAMPNWHRLAEKYSSGQMYSTDYGGGTANIEFEVNTGLSNYWADTVPYTDILPRIDSIQSVASAAKAGGYDTIAVHPFVGGMYKRNFALPKQGFDQFIDLSMMDSAVYERDAEGNEIGYVTDQSSYDQVLKILNENENRQMIGLITMQNHAPYTAEWYESFDFEVTGDDEPDNLEKTSAFMQVISRTDAYLAEFIEKLDALEEPTVMLFYGDHAPGVYAKISAHDEQAVRDLSRLTPYFIYTNFEMKRVDLPTTTPNCLVNTLYNVLNVKKPALNYLLDEVCAQTPILTGFYLGEKGPFQSTELSEYEMIIYDILGGEQYWYKYIGKD